MNAWRVWANACAERRLVACIWLLSECDWISGHRISHKKYTCIQNRNCESGLAKASCTQAGPAHAAGHVEMAWTDESHFIWHALPVAPITVARRDLSAVTGTVSLATKTNGIDRLPCGYLYRSRHWIGKSTSSLHPHHRGGRLFMVHVFNCCPRALFELVHDAKRAKCELTYGKWSVETSKQASKHTHTRVQWSHASVGLAQARPQ